MSVYTISPCLFQCGLATWSTILAHFITNSDLKLALDSQGKAMDKYSSLEIPDKYDLLSVLSILGKISKIEKITINNKDDHDLFIDICCNTIGEHNIIVQTKQNFGHLNFIDSNTIDINNNVQIKIYDNGEIISKFSPPTQLINIGNISESTFTGFGNINNM